MGEPWVPLRRWRDPSVDRRGARRLRERAGARPRSRERPFYGDTLGLERNPNSGDRWVEFEAGNVTLALVSPAALGPDFEPRPNQMPIAFRVDDVEVRMRKLEEAESSFHTA